MVVRRVGYMAGVLGIMGEGVEVVSGGGSEKNQDFLWENFDGEMRLFPK